MTHVSKTPSCLVAILFWMASPSLFAQDFLKQLEEKLLQKQSSQKKEEPPKGEVPPTEPTKEPGAQPLNLALQNS